MKSLFVTVALLAAAAAGQTKPNPLTGLAAVHSIFVKGNSESATWIRRELVRQAKVFPKHHREICLSLADNPKKADAVLDINEAFKAAGILSDPGVTASGTLTDAAGDLLWSDAKGGSSGFIHSGAGGASQFLLLSLEKRVCPKWHHL